MAGALAESLFVHKIERAGFADVSVVERHGFSLDDAARYPLFTPDLMALMRALIPAAQQQAVAVGVTVTATKPGQVVGDAVTSQDAEGALIGAET